jgi:hypothetical protein
MRARLDRLVDASAVDGQGDGCHWAIA